MASSAPMIHSLSKSPHLPICFSFFLSYALINVAAHYDFHFNSDGNVLELHDSNFRAAISNFDYILVDFYAPWCVHCSHLAPELEKAAVDLAGLKQPVVIAKVDADKYRNLASTYNIGGYPTLKIFEHGIPTNYYGPRKAEALVRFLRKRVAPNVALLSSDVAVKDFIDAAGSELPIFVGFGLNESVMLDPAIRYKKRAWFSVANDFSDEFQITYHFDKVPALVVIHSAYQEHSVFYGPFEGKFIEDFIRQSLLPLVLPINQDTLELLKDDTRQVVLTIMEDETTEKSQSLIKSLKKAASSSRDFIFGYVGVKQWKYFTDTFEDGNNTRLPKMVTWDGGEKYYMVTGQESMDEEGDADEHVSRFVEGYREGRVIERSLKGQRFLWETGVIIVGLVVLVAIVVWVILLTMKVESSDTEGGVRVSMKED